MRKALLIVAVLLLATPVMAGVTITAVQEGSFIYDGNRVQTVRIDYSSDVNVRAIALDINIDCNGNVPNFQGIRGYKTGESNAVSPGYGIFPSRFRDFVNPLNPGPNYVDPEYNPTTAWDEPGTTDHTWGMGFPRMIVELGTLYAGDANKPALSGTLFRFDVNAWGQVGTFYLKIAADTLRGGTTGAIGSDGNSVASTFVGTSITFASLCTTPTDEVGQPRATAEAVWAVQGFTPITGTGAYSDTIPVNQVMTQDTACVTTPAPLAYGYSLGRFPTPTQLIYPKFDADSNLPVYWAGVAGATGYQLDRSADSGNNWTNVYSGTATFKAESVASAPNYRYRVRAKNADSNSLYLSGTFDCNAYLSKCYASGSTSDANWANWLSAGRPDCWCKLSTAQEPNGSGYQCDGDADGATSGAPNNYRVYSGDLNILTGNWKKKASNLTNDPNNTMAGRLKIVGACGDIDHKSSGAPNNYRVYSGDLNILTGNWKKKNSNFGTNCPRPTP